MWLVCGWVVSDTPSLPRCAVRAVSTEIIGGMSAVKGRAKRPTEGQKVLFAKIAEENHSKASAAAQAMGISLAAYVDLVLDREQVDASGRPIWAPQERMTFEELRELEGLGRVS